MKLSRTQGGIDPARLFMWMFIASESTFFAFLIVAYVYFHTFRALPGEPTAANSLDPLKSGIFTAFLLSSSLTFWLGERALFRGRVVQLKYWLALTVFLGAVFLIGQASEYAHLIRHDVTISRNVFGSSFFTLTGLHGLHVLMGLIGISVMLLLSLSNVFEPPASTALECVGLYWHFVDAVWIVLFSLIYLGASL